MANEITILICGTQQGNAGYSELLVVGNSPLGKEDVIYPPQYASTNYCVRVRHTCNYIEYLLICNPSIIRSYGASRNGRLSFFITIKRGYKLADGRSPLDLLLDVRNEFMKQNMTLSSDETYSFKPGKYDSLPFRQILSKYDLIESRRYVEMSGSSAAYIAVSDKNSLECFLRDSQYKEFTAYSSVWVGNTVAAGDFINLAIPRVPIYQVFVNDKSVGSVVGNGTFNKLICSDSQYCSDAQLEFIQEQLNSSWSQPNVKFLSKDDNREEIRFEVSFPEKIYIREFKFNFGNLPANDISTIKKSLRLIKSLNKEKELEWSGNSAKVTFWGQEIVEKWDFSPSSDFSYSLKSNPFDANSRESQFLVTVTRIFHGFKLCNISKEMIGKQIKLDVNFRNRRRSFCKDLEPSNRDNEMCLNISGINIDDIDAIDSIEIICDGYGFDVPDPGKIEGGWYCIVMPKYTKIIFPEKPVIVSESVANNKSAEVVRLTFNGLDNRKCDVVLDLGNHSKLEKELLDGDNVIDLPSGTKIKEITYQIKGYKDFTVTINDSKQFEFDIPPKMEKLTIWDYFVKFNLIQYILIFSLSFLLGAGAFYHFAKNHSDFICQIIGIVPPPEDDTPPINPDPAASSPSREGNLVSEDAAGTGSVYQQPSTPPQTPMPGGPQNNQGQGPAPEVNQVYPQLARKIREYRSACADATLEFTKISELGKFLEKNPNCDATLKNYYEIYKAAYEALRVLVPQNSKTYEGTLDDFRKICIPINETANMSTELTTFRDCFQVIFLKDGKGQNIVFNELAWNPRSLDFSKYTSFSSLKQLKADIEISKYE